VYRLFSRPANQKELLFAQAFLLHLDCCRQQMNDWSNWPITRQLSLMPINGGIPEEFHPYLFPAGSLAPA
jgi:hypothetical protein